MIKFSEKNNIIIGDDFSSSFAASFVQQSPIFIVIFLTCPGLFLYQEIIAGDDWTAYLDGGRWVSAWSVQIGRPLRGLINNFLFDGFPIRPASLFAFMLAVSTYSVAIVTRLKLPRYLCSIICFSILSSGFLIELYQFSIMQSFSAIAFFLLTFFIFLDEKTKDHPVFLSVFCFAVGAGILGTIRIEFFLCGLVTFIMLTANNQRKPILAIGAFVGIALSTYILIIIGVSTFLNIALGASNPQYSISKLQRLAHSSKFE